jgi:hypothetical protein
MRGREAVDCAKFPGAKHGLQDYFIRPYADLADRNLSEAFLTIRADEDVNPAVNNILGSPDLVGKGRPIPFVFWAAHRYHDPCRIAKRVFRVRAARRRGKAKPSLNRLTDFPAHKI